MTSTKQEVSVIDPNTLDELERLDRDATPAPWWLDRDAVESCGGPVVTAWAFNGDVELVIALRNAARGLVAEARESVRLREELDTVTTVLNACNEPATYADGTEASVGDRIQSFGLRFHHAVLLASLADSKLRMDSTPVPRKEGDKMPVAMAWISRHFTEQIEAVPEAKNYVSWGWTDNETGKAYTVTVQRTEGKTPAVIAAEAREDAARLRERVAELERAAKALIDCVDRGDVGTSARHDATNALRAALTPEPR